MHTWLFLDYTRCKEGEGESERANVLKRISSSSAVSTNYNNNPAEILKKILYHVVKMQLTRFFAQSVSVYRMCLLLWCPWVWVSLPQYQLKTSHRSHHRLLLSCYVRSFPFRECRVPVVLANSADGLFCGAYKIVLHRPLATYISLC